MEKRPLEATAREPPRSTDCGELDDWSPTGVGTRTHASDGPAMKNA